MLYCGRWRTTLTKLTSIASPSPPLSIFTDINNNWQRVNASQRESRQTCAKTPTLPKVQQISVSTKGNTWSCLVNLGKYHPSKDSASYVQLRYPNPLYVISQHFLSSILSFFRRSREAIPGFIFSCSVTWITKRLRKTWIQLFSWYFI